MALSHPKVRAGLGISGISVPCGQTMHGLPIGVQILAGHFAEGKLLRVAQAVEAAQPKA